MRRNPAPKQKTLTCFFKPLEEKKDENTSLYANMTPYNKAANFKDVRAYLKKIDSQRQNADRWLHWEGFLFLATNNFRDYQVLTMIPRANFLAHYPSGFVVATATVDDDSALTHIQVHSDFRRQKIGSELIRFISKACKQFTVYGGNGTTNSRYRLTKEGAHLITYCQKKDILKHTQVILGSVPESPALSQRSYS